MIDVGLLSTAHVHAEDYTPILREMGGVRVAGVADEDAERGREFANEHDIAYHDSSELLSNTDCVVVCSTNAAHRKWVERAADAGVDVLCEKPLAPNSIDGKEMVERCAAADVELGVAMPLRFSVPAREGKSSLAAGDIGSLRAITGTNRGKMPGGWFVDAAQSGGGAVMDHTVHIVDLVQWLTGERVAEVYAETASRLHGVSVEDVNVLSMELTDGTQFSLDGSWSKPDDWTFWGDATVTLFGDDGVLSVDCFDQTYTRTRESEGVESAFWGTDPNRGMLRDFVDAVEAGTEPETTGRAALAVLDVVEAAYASAEAGEAKRVEYRG